jgi:D-alanine--poly(phosphoribitol) ligase subunit 1
MRSTVLQDLEKITFKYPNKVAFADLKEEFSFSNLLNCSKRIGSYIAQRVSTHNPVIVYMEKRAYNIPAFLGAAYAGCFYVPIDSQMPPERINLILDTLHPSIIIFDEVTKKNVDAISNGIYTVNYRDAVSCEIDQEKLDHIRLNAKSTDLLYVLFTSGSTGVPKGVTLSHAAVIDFMDWVCEKYYLDDSTTLCNQAPFYFDASVPDLYIPLKTGATVYIPPKIYYTFPKKILQFIIEKEINTLVWVPSALCNVVNCRAFNVAVPTTIKLVIFCGEVMPCKHLNVWKKFIPDALYVNMYGPTEATYACMYYDINRDFRDDEKLPLGKACENSEILLITDENKEARENEIGEICILGQCLSNGYYNNPEKTNAAFVQNPLNSKWIELMYRTGDLAYKKDGNIVFAGRKDFQVKRLGHRIELGEIENAIMSIEAVETACCVFNPKNGDIIAIYTGKIESDEVSRSVEDKLPHYMFPSRYEHLKAMPMNLNGKIDRIKLNKEYTEVE